VAYPKLHVDFGMWGLVRKASMIVFCVAAVGLLAAFYIPILKQSRAFQMEIDQKRAALRTQMEIHRRLTEELQLLKTSPLAVEQAVREKLGLVKPNEVIYRFEPDGG
jgi:cell division protein FtsB